MGNKRNRIVTPQQQWNKLNCNAEYAMEPNYYKIATVCVKKNN